MSIIKINTIKPQEVELYNPDGLLMGNVNEFELNDIRIQIRENQAEGYYCLFNNEKILITKNGKFMRHPIGFFDLMCNQLTKLI